jgi:hypothetical protein
MSRWQDADGDTELIPARRTVRGVNFILAAGLMAAAIGGPNVITAWWGRNTPTERAGRGVQRFFQLADAG